MTKEEEKLQTIEIIMNDIMENGNKNYPLLSEKQYKRYVKKIGNLYEKQLSKVFDELVKESDGLINYLEKSECLK